MPHLPQAAAVLPARAWLARLPAAAAWPFIAVWSAFWWSLKRHVCDRHFYPREAAGPPPFAWLAEEPAPPRPRLETDAYGRWRWRA